MRKLRVDTRKEDKDGQVSKLKDRVRRLKKDKDRMAEQIKQLRRHINEQQEYINKHVSDKTVKQVIKENELNEKIACINCESHDIVIKELPFGSMINCNECKSVNINKGK